MGWDLKLVTSFLISSRVQRAETFLLFVKVYSKHEATCVFQIKKRDLIGVAHSFGLL